MEKPLGCLKDGNPKARLPVAGQWRSKKREGWKEGWEAECECKVSGLHFLSTDGEAECDVLT